MKEEKDPNGVAPNQPGAKLDHGKLRAGLVIKGFQNALKAVAEVGTFGANKYTDDGWKSVPDGLKRYEDALYRHLLADGVDEQSGLPHLAHAAWNILAMLELQATIQKVAADGPVYNSRSWYDLYRKVTRGTWREMDADLAFREPTRREISEAEKACQGAFFTDEQLKQFEVNDSRLSSESPAYYNWQFSREMWEFAYCNPKNANLFEMVKARWASYKSRSGVSVVLLDKDLFNASDLVVDGIHIPSLPKELINAALLRCYPLGASRFSSVATTLIKAGIGFIDHQENK